MFPAVPSMVAGAFSGIGNSLPKLSREQWMLLVKILGVASGLLAIILIGRRVIKSWRNDAQTNRYDKQNNTGRATQMAHEFLAAFNPSGYTWLMGIDGTNEDIVYALAQEMNEKGINLSQVNQSYDGEFLLDLRSELDSLELARFNSILNGKETFTLSGISQTTYWEGTGVQTRPQTMCNLSRQPGPSVGIYSRFDANRLIYG